MLDVRLSVRIDRVPWTTDAATGMNAWERGRSNVATQKSLDTLNHAENNCERLGFHRCVQRPCVLSGFCVTSLSSVAGRRDLAKQRRREGCEHLHADTRED